MADRRWDDSSILRDLRAEARRQERGRLVDLLAASARNDELAAERYSKRPAMTGLGRRAAGLRQAIEVIDGAGKSTWAANPGEAYAFVSNECDSVELYAYDPTQDQVGANDEHPEPKPIRLVVCDGAEDTIASAYLSLDDAEEAGLALIHLVHDIRESRARREAATTSDGEP